MIKVLLLTVCVVDFNAVCYVETIQVCLLTVCVVDFNAVCYDRDNSSLPT